MAEWQLEPLRAPAILLLVLVLVVNARALAQSGADPDGVTRNSSEASLGPREVGDLRPPEPPRPLAETLTGKAKSDYEAALLLYDSGDFRGAARSFLSAHEHSKDVRLLWNAAACEQALRHYSKAIALVRRYLASQSPLITADNERNAHDFLKAALPLTARVSIVSADPGATLYVDDELTGTLPLEQELRVDFGSHRATLKKPGFFDATKSFTVTSAADVLLELPLVPRPIRGRLVVHAGRQDSILIDGRLVAVGRFDGTVPAGKHVVRVQAEGSKGYESRVLIENGQTRSLDVVLEPEPAGVPSWVWWACGAALAAGAGAAGYFLFKSSDEPEQSLPPGSIGNVQLPLRRGMPW